MKTLLLLPLAFGIILLGCSKESTTPTPTPKNYAPSTTGTYYLHYNTESETSSSGSDSVTGDYTDSTVVHGTETVSDDKAIQKTAVKNTIHFKSLATRDQYYAQEGAKFYQLFNLDFNVGGTNVDLGKAWIQIDDQNNASWESYQDSVSNLTFDVGVPVTANVKIKFSGRKVGTEDLTIDGKTVSTSRSTIDANITIYTALGSVPVNVKMDYWFAADVGVVKYVQPPVTFSMLVFGTMSMPGTTSVVTKYSIK